LRALVTGFESFAGYRVNPSSMVVERLSREGVAWGDSLELYTAILPVSFKRAGKTLQELLGEYRPDIYIGLGVAAGIPYIAVERIAVNIMDARIPDNDGEQPIDEPVDPEGPVAYFATLPIKAIVKRLRENGIPTAVSNTAGTFLCNYVTYLSIHYSKIHGYPRRAGFIHLPLLPEQAAEKREGCGIQASMSLDLMVRAVKIALETTMELIDKPDEKYPV